LKGQLATAVVAERTELKSAFEAEKISKLADVDELVARVDEAYRQKIDHGDFDGAVPLEGQLEELNKNRKDIVADTFQCNFEWQARQAQLSKAAGDLEAEVTRRTKELQKLPRTVEEVHAQARINS